VGERFLFVVTVGKIKNRNFLILKSIAQYRGPVTTHLLYFFNAYYKIIELRIAACVSKNNVLFYKVLSNEVDRLFALYGSWNGFMVL
jgi:hypothetical protein